MKQAIVTRSKAAMVICQAINDITDIDTEGFFEPVPCGCIMLMAHARAVDWKCPKCKHNEKEQWKPSSVEALQATREQNMLTETIEEATI